MNSNRYYKAILFDLNGTLIELFKISEYLTQLKEISKILNLDFNKFEEAWAASWKKFPLADFETIEILFHEALTLYHGHSDYSIEESNLNKAIEHRMKYISDQLEKIKPGAIEFIEWVLKQGYKIGMVSNCSTDMSVSWESSSLFQYFPNPTFSCDLKSKKPDPKIFLTETDRLGVKPEKCIYVADGDDFEFKTAKKLGMQVILIKYELDDTYRNQPFPEVEFSTYKFSEIPNIIKELEKRRSKN